MYCFLGYFTVISLISIIICCYDKAAAIKNKRRISEKALINLSLLGGAIAMYTTMCLIRHKTKHLKFMAGLPLIIALQTALIIVVLKNIV